MLVLRLAALALELAARCTSDQAHQNLGNSGSLIGSALPSLYEEDQCM
jgi:hypothetical protein